MTSFFQQQFTLIPFYCLFLVLTVLSLDHIFFWDTVQLGSLHAHHFFENGLDSILLPNNIDSGHIPTFGIYIAIWWKLLGKELWVSHLAMLPYLFGIVWQSNLLLRYFIPQPYVFPALLLFLIEPTLLGQSILISPDIVLVFCFLLGLNGIIKHNRLLLLLGILGLFLISLRGLMVAFALLLFDLYLNVWRDKEFNMLKLLRLSLAYWPAVLLILPYFIYHFIEKDWIAYHPDSPWMLSFERVGISGFIYNIGLMAWRILDFGRVFLVLLIGIIVLTRLGKIQIQDKFKMLLVLFTILSFCLGYSFTTYKYLSAHRYLLPLLLVLGLIFSYLLFNFVKHKTIRKSFLLIALAGLLSGHLWIYPEGIAQGWDASLAHWPYYELRDKMIDYLDSGSISYSYVAAEFPNVSERRFMELSDSHERHQYLDLDLNQYVLYSNVYNNIDDKEINKLKRKFSLKKTFEKGGVFISLYKVKSD